MTGGIINVMQQSMSLVELLIFFSEKSTVYAVHSLEFQANRFDGTNR